MNAMRSTKSTRSTAIPAVLCIAIMAPLVVGDVCGPQAYRPLTGYAVQIDANQIAMGPADANGLSKRLLLRVLTVPLGAAATDKIGACDPDGDLLAMSCQDGLLTALPPDPNGMTYHRWTWTPTSIGVTYHWIEAKDQRPATNDSIATRGTIVVVAIPRNRPPVLCGGQP